MNRFERIVKMNMDELVRAISAFGGWDDLEHSLKVDGYVPTIIPYRDEPAEKKAAKAEIVKILQQKGYRVWQGSFKESLIKAEREYVAARKTAMRLKGQYHRVDHNGDRLYPSTYAVPGYTQASERLEKARKVLVKAKRDFERVYG
jgi:hypothetical protein